MIGENWSSFMYYWGAPLIVMLIFFRFARKNVKRLDEYYKRNWTNQEEMIAILKEIRDTLKKEN